MTSELHPPSPLFGLLGGVVLVALVGALESASRPYLSGGPQELSGLGSRHLVALIGDPAMSKALGASDDVGWEEAFVAFRRPPPHIERMLVGTLDTQIAERISVDLQESKPDVLLVIADVGFPGRSNSKQAEAGYHPNAGARAGLEAVVDALGVPVWLIQRSGNHAPEWLAAQSDDIAAWGRAEVITLGDGPFSTALVTAMFPTEP